MPAPPWTKPRKAVLVADTLPTDPPTEPTREAMKAALTAVYPNLADLQPSYAFEFCLRPDEAEKVRRVALALDEFAAQAVKRRNARRRSSSRRLARSG